MSTPNLPVGPLGEDPSQLPVRRDGALARPDNAQVLDLLRDGGNDNPDEIDLLAYWRMLVKRRWLIAALVAAGAAIALVMTLKATPMYRATAVVKIDTASQSIVQMGEFGSPYDWDPDFLTTQIGVLTSRSLAERVAEDLRLDAAALARLQPPSWLERLKGTLKPTTAAGPSQDSPPRSRPTRPWPRPSAPPAPAPSWAG